jgi:hypothetical protein
MTHTITPNIIVDQAIIDTLTGDLADLVPTITTAQSQQDSIQATLADDSTKTEPEANTAAQAEAANLKQSISAAFVDRKSSLESQKSRYLRKTQGARVISGILDFNILQSFLPLFTTKTKVLSLAASDKQAARAAMLLPAIRHQFSLTANDLATIDDSFNQHYLDAEFTDLQTTKTDIVTLGAAITGRIQVASAPPTKFNPDFRAKTLAGVSHFNNFLGREFNKNSITPISFLVIVDRSVFLGKNRLMSPLICSTNPFSQLW